LKVGITDNYPLLYYDKANDTAAGLFPDILKRIASENGWNLVYVYVDWKTVFSDLENGTIDILPDVGFSKTREKYIKYSSITITNNWGVIFKKLSGEDAYNIFNLENKKVALVNNIYYNYLKNEAKDFNVDVNFDLVDSYSDALKKLENGKADFAVVNRYYAIANSQKFKGIEKTNYIFSPIQLRFAFRKDIDPKIIKEFDNTLDKMIGNENSYYYEVLERYATEFEKKTYLPQWFYPLLIIGGIIGGVLIFTVYFLRWIIKLKTRELRKTNAELLKNHEELEKSYEEVNALNKELESSYTELDKYVATLDRIYTVIMKLNYKNVSLEEISDDLLRLALDAIEEADTGSVSIREGDKWRFLATIGHDKEALNAINLPAKYFIMPKKTIIIKNINEKNLSMMPEKIFKEFKKASVPIKHTVLAPIKIGDKIQGNLAVDIAKEGKSFSSNSIKAIKAIAAIGSSFLTMNNYAKLQGELQKDVILSLIRIVEIFDPYTEGHSEFVAEYSSRLAEFMNLPKEIVKKIYWAGLLHDIGKIGVPINVLNKKGKLTDEEYGLVKQHPILGYDVLSSSEKLKDLAVIVRHHHERYDGKGYPDRKKEEEIPLESRIIAVIDTWHAMRSDRPYRKALKFEEAFVEIKKGIGSQFDPDVAQAFISMLNGYYKDIL
jgi:HD-GYP domain-containing protein (c-di-GMP phosphodiesterase class II)/ABC-type amino acid transport substrate-binding protein